MDTSSISFTWCLCVKSCGVSSKYNQSLILQYEQKPIIKFYLSQFQVFSHFVENKCVPHCYEFFQFDALQQFGFLSVIYVSLLKNTL